jgi:hypothetical protein
VQAAAVATYIGISLLCFFTPWGPRVFWTIVLPLLIVSIVLMGFNTWRRICPLEVLGSFGVRLKPKGKRVTVDGNRGVVTVET